MDPNYNIYSAPEGDIPEADKARLDGFLKGREEAALLAEREAAIATFEAEMEALRQRLRDEQETT